MKLRNLIIIIGLILCVYHPAWAKWTKHHKKKKAHRAYHVARIIRRPAPIASAAGTTQLNSILSSFITPNDKTADIAVYVKSMRNGETLYSRNITQALTPASTLKILTAEAALLYLGSSYRFSTQLLTDAANTSQNVLQGNLYIVLSGDPTLDYEDVLSLMGNLKAKHINKITGNVIIDDTAYDQNIYGPGWVWKDKSYCYAAPIGASIINHNCLSFQVAPAKLPGRPAQVVLSPKYFYPAIRNAVTTKNSRARACYVRLTPQAGNVALIEGCMPRGQYAWGMSYVVNDLPEYDKALVKNALRRVGVSVAGNIAFGKAGNKLNFIGQHASAPLNEIVSDMLKKSDNIIAGALFKKVGQLYLHQRGSWLSGSQAVNQILAKHAGISASGSRILDGSGLSPDNLVTPQQMMQVLSFAYHHSGTSYDFISALPIAGVDGTLKHRMGNIRGKVRAKTGTISGVVSLAGYTVTADKEPLAFVIMINGAKGLGWRYKAMEDNIVTALTRYRRA